MKLITTLVCASAFASLAACAAGEGESSTALLTAPPGQCGVLETHVFGIYASPTGESTVEIARPGRHAIVLSAYEETTWRVKVSNGAELEAIYAVGYEKQRVIAPTGVKVVTESHAEGGAAACGYQLGASGGGCDTEALLDLTRIRVHAETSFHGCYEASSWKVGEDLAVTSNCAVDKGYEQSDLLSNCDAETAAENCGGPIFL